MGAPSSSKDYGKIEACLKLYTSNYSNSAYSDTNQTYLELYQNMLESVYENEGFWIGRYEAGIEGENSRTLHTDIATSGNAVIKQNKIPYNYITRDEVQKLASEMNYDGATSSLIFGIQWDLALKYIETKKATATNNLTTNSTKIGNHKNNLWNITNKSAKYSKDAGSTYLPCPYEKKEEEGVLLTTGADESFSLMNIYDIAGNIR